MPDRVDRTVSPTVPAIARPSEQRVPKPAPRLRRQQYRQLIKSGRSLPRAAERLLRSLGHGGCTAQHARSILRALADIARCYRIDLCIETAAGRTLPWIVRLLRGTTPMRMRRVVRRSAPLQTFEFASVKMATLIGRDGHLVECEGHNEYHFAHHLEIDWTVHAFWEQPFVLLFQYDGRLASYTPDFEVVRSDGGVVIVDVKPDSRPDPRLAAAEAALQRLGMAFRIVTMSEIHRLPRWRTVLDLADYRSVLVPFASRLAVMARLADAAVARRRLTLGDLVAPGPDAGGVCRDHVLALIARGELRIDLDRPVDTATTVRWAGRT